MKKLCLVSFVEETKHGDRLWEVVERNGKFTVEVTEQNVRGRVAGCGWYHTKVEACERLQEYADFILGVARKGQDDE